ncbi:phosphodiester glycosidase family protein, partial [Sphingobacterium sp. SGG-5]|uniref:phosphodiester glycosidase family protein n=1 Tax=Sphingobacterium sp. SGG-5 TaxID=2710881 RepID=UPI0013EC6875
MCRSQMKYIATICIVFIAASCSAQKSVTKTTGGDIDGWYSYNKHYDEQSETYYFLTRIKHTDSQWRLKKLKLAQSTVLEGEAVREFAERTKVTLAFNASMGVKRKTEQDKLLPVGIQIENGKVLQNRRTRVYTLGIKANNELVAYPPGTTPQQILKDGAQDALTAFIPLIENHQVVDESLLDIVTNFRAIHPRQIIAQMDNLDIVFLSCGGR